MTWTEVDTGIAWESFRPFAAVALPSGALAVLCADGRMRWVDAGWKVTVDVEHAVSRRRLVCRPTVVYRMFDMSDADGDAVGVLTADFAVHTWSADAGWTTHAPPPALQSASAAWLDGAAENLRRPVAADDGRGALYLSGLVDSTPGRPLPTYTSRGELYRWTRRDGWTCVSTEAPPLVAGSFGYDRRLDRVVWAGGRHVPDGSHHKRCQEWDGSSWKDVGKAVPKPPEAGTAWSAIAPRSGRMAIQGDHLALYAGHGQFVLQDGTEAPGNFDKRGPAAFAPDGTLWFVLSNAGSVVARLPADAYGVSDEAQAALDARHAPSPRKASARKASPPKPPKAPSTPEPPSMEGGVPLADLVPNRLHALSLIEQLWAAKVVKRPTLGPWIQHAVATGLVDAVPTDWKDYSSKDLQHWYRETHGYGPHPALEAWVLSARVTPEAIAPLKAAAISHKTIAFLSPLWDGEDDAYGDGTDG